MEKKRRTSFLAGLFLLLLLLMLLCVAVIGLVALRDRVPLIGRATVALVEVEGIITDTGPVIEQLRKFADNPLVRAIVVRIESPGGTVGGSQELHSEILKARKKKPIVASLGNIAASGGYYVACAANEILANPGTVTGSIGVIFRTYDLRGISKKIGIGVNTVKSGKFKDTGSAFREMTPEERRLIQETIDDTYDQFLEAVLEGRKLQLARAFLQSSPAPTTPTISPDDNGSTRPGVRADWASPDDVPDEVVKSYLRSFADGRVLSGRQAVKMGLVDRLGTLQDAIERAGQLGGVRGRPFVVRPKRKPKIWDLIESRLAQPLPGLPPRHGVALEYRLSFD